MNWNFMIFYDSISSGASLSAKSGKESITKVVLFSFIAPTGAKEQRGQNSSVLFLLSGGLWKFIFYNLHTTKQAKPAAVTSRERFSLKGGGCGAENIKFKRCPASAAPFESRLFGKGHRGKRKGKGSRCGAAASIARSIPNTIHGERSSQSHNYAQSVEQ